MYMHTGGCHVFASHMHDTAMTPHQQASPLSKCTRLRRARQRLVPGPLACCGDPRHPPRKFAPARAVCAPRRRRSLLHTGILPSDMHALALPSRAPGRAAQPLHRAMRTIAPIATLHRRPRTAAHSSPSFHQYHCNRRWGAAAGRLPPPADRHRHRRADSDTRSGPAAAPPPQAVPHHVPR